MYTDPMTLVIPVPAGPPLSSASSPWRCSFPVPCFAPAEPGPRPCPPRAPLSAPRAASYTPACNTKTHTHLRKFQVLAIEFIPKLYNKICTSSTRGLKTLRKAKQKRALE